MGSNEKTDIAPAEQINQQSSSGEASKNLAVRAFGPASDEFGTELAPAGKEAGKQARKLAGTALRFTGSVIYGLDRVYDWIENAVAKRIEGLPEEDLVEASPRVLFPAAQALVYTGEDEEIREVFANLIASDVTRSKKQSVHPAFVELIKEMSSSEARLLKLLKKTGDQRHLEVRAKSKENNHWNVVGGAFSFRLPDVLSNDLPTMVSNLERLGLLRMDESKWPTSTSLEEWENKTKADMEKRLSDTLAAANQTCSFQPSGLFMTPLGNAFCNVCL